MTNLTPLRSPTAPASSRGRRRWGRRIQGYRIYRSGNADGPYVPIHSGQLAQTTITDSFTVTGQHHYMVRAVKLENTPSGSYSNGSTGVFAATTGAITTQLHPPEHSQDHRPVRPQRSMRAHQHRSHPRQRHHRHAHQHRQHRLDNYDTGTNTATFSFTNIPGR